MIAQRDCFLRGLIRWAHVGVILDHAWFRGQRPPFAFVVFIQSLYRTLLPTRRRTDYRGRIMFGNALYSARRFARRGSDGGHAPTSGRHIRSRRSTRRIRAAASVAAVALLGGVMVTSAGVNADGVVGQGFTITPPDLRFILDQIKIAEAHVVNTTTATGPCGALLGTGANQIPSPLLPFGLRTVDGSCNNLIAGQETFGAADQP